MRDRLSEKANGTRQKGHRRTRNTKVNAEGKDCDFLSEIKLAFFHLFLRIYKHLFAHLYMSRTNIHFAMYEVLNDED